MQKYIEETFFTDIAKHEMIVIRDDGVHRHIRFKVPETTCMHFDLVTWPGYLCYSGDMGCFVFSRLHDMFEFFRTDRKYNQSRCRKLAINLSYWSEKLQAVDGNRNGGNAQEFSFEKFKENVLDYIKRHEEDNLPGNEHDQDAFLQHAAAYGELRDAVTSDVLSFDDNPVRAYDAANDFRHEGDAWAEFHGNKSNFEFSDFWEVDNTEYTHRFVWCCYALAWGIEQYDKANNHAHT